MKIICQRERTDGALISQSQHGFTTSSLAGDGRGVTVPCKQAKDKGLEEKQVTGSIKPAADPPPSRAFLAGGKRILEGSWGGLCIRQRGGRPGRARHVPDRRRRVIFVPNGAQDVRALQRVKIEQQQFPKHRDDGDSAGDLVAFERGVDAQCLGCLVGSS